MSDNLTPMMRQYKEAKESIPKDAVLLFRLGDFYEEFFEDAEKVSSALELVLTKRQGIPMCGFPHHALNNYLPRLVAAGLKVAIAEQMEDPKLAKGIVKRQITRIVTPGTLVEGDMLSSDCNNFLVAVTMKDNLVSCMAAIDASTGEFFYSLPKNTEQLLAELARLGAREILVPSSSLEAFRLLIGVELPQDTIITELDNYDFDREDNTKLLCEHFKSSTLDGFGLRDYPQAAEVGGALLRYITNNLRGEVNHITWFEYHSLEKRLELDAISLRNLEIIANRSDNTKRGTLLSVLDKTSTSMGGRKLRTWLLNPLANKDEIVARLDVVEEFVQDPLTLTEFQETLRIVRDLERITARINIGSATPRDFVSLSSSLSVLPGIKNLLSEFNTSLVKEQLNNIEDFSTLTNRIDQTITDEPPISVSDGGVIRSGFNADLDEFRNASTEGKTWLASIQQRECERTGIKSLKVKFNSVFGYYIEVSKSNLDLVPDDYIRKQTLVNAERFITPELKELESKILGAEEKAIALETQIFAELRLFALDFTKSIQDAADALATIDALSGLAESARSGNYKRPEILENDTLKIVGGRHPVIEKSLSENAFVPNDTLLDGDENRMMLITGPNMAGKSTYLRQVAIIVLMAQCGSFVPAESASIGLVDRIFTRIGAGDDLLRNQSTFMVEMVETSNILRNATSKSLVILDEIGRGTSTFDGLSIAWSVAEFLHDDPRCRTLFATHYHELTELSETRRGVNNYNVAVKEYGDDIIFLRQIVPGASDRSYGIHVAKLAGIPYPILERANVILELLEKAADAPRDAIAALPKRTIKHKRKSDEEDDMIQLMLL